MRITNKMIAMNMLAAVGRNRELQAKLQLDIATSRKLRRPSDDPAGLVKMERLKTLASKNEQYVKNLTFLNDSMNASSSALEGVLASLEQAKGIAIQGASDTLNAVARQTLATQVDQLIGAVLDDANAKHRGRYLFAGTLTQGTVPFDRTGDVITYNGNNKAMKGIIGFDAEVNYNKTGNEVFDPAAGVDIFATLIALKQGLENNDTSAIQGTLDSLNGALEQVLAVSSEFGGLQNRLSSTELFLENENINFASAISRIQDTDMIEALVTSQIIDNAITAGLRTMADMIQVSLVDFIS